MSGSLTTRGITILIVILLAAWSVYPPQEKINLGLDLRGGMHLVMQVETDDALEAETDKDIDLVTQELENEGFTGVEVERTGDTSFALVGITPDIDSWLRENVLETFFRDRWNMDSTGTRAVFDMTAFNKGQVRDLSVRQAQETIRNRIDSRGIAEPVIHREGIDGNRIVIQLPGVDDPERIKRLIKSTAFLEFRLAIDDIGPTPTEQAILDYYGGVLPPDVEIFPENLRGQDKNIIGQQFWALEKRRVVTGRDLKDASPSSGEFNEPVVRFRLTHEGGQNFGKITEENINRRLAIILDHTVVSAPSIRDRITDEGVIHGSFSEEEVQDLVTTLRSGALPAGLTALEERTVGPSLGRDSIEKGQKAGLIGGAFVILLMLGVYKLTGINAVTALTLNVVLVFGTLALFGATLTLPGIAGIVLTIGMAVDANVLVFERIKEEIKAGRTVKSAIAAGFQKALSSILDANITTLIAAMFLFLFGTGPIRGFAVTLSVGILASIFTAVFVSRWLFDLVYSRKQRAESISI